MKHKREFIPALVLTALSITLAFLPNGFEAPQSKHSELAKVEVTGVDNSLIHVHGIIRSGSQLLEVRVLSGQFEGREARANNFMMGKLELDKMFDVGDVALATIKHRDGAVRSIDLHDHYRLNVELVLFALFFICVVLVAGRTGLNAIMTFIFTALFLWKVLFPAFLSRHDPIWTSVGAMALLAFVIIFSIAGFNRKGLVAFLGAISGVLVTCLLSLLFAHFFRIHGAVRAFSETLLHTGFPWINISHLFIAGIFIASSGAVMDVAMDISASMNEVTGRAKTLSFRERFKSGMAVGRAVIGTMTTTLLLAYTGGYTAMFMVFITQGAPIERVLNIQYISAELLHTLVGSFGLVIVAPLTALFGAFVFQDRTNTPSETR